MNQEERPDRMIDGGRAPMKKAWVFVLATAHREAEERITTGKQTTSERFMGGADPALARLLRVAAETCAVLREWHVCSGYTLRDTLYTASVIALDERLAPTTGGYTQHQFREALGWTINRRNEDEESVTDANTDS